MFNRKLLSLGAAGLFVAMLAAAMALQRGSAQASNLAQATDTDLVTATDDTGTPGGTGTPDETGTPDDTGTPIGTPSGTATDDETGTPAGTGTARATVTPRATGEASGTPTTRATGSPTPAATRTSPTPVGGGGQVTGTMPARTITVSGLGEASAPPDEAYVSVGVQTDADTATEAMNQNNQQMGTLTQALLDAGVTRDDIQTQYVTLFPRYTDGGGGTTGISGYTASSSVEVHVTDLDTLGDLLDAAVAGGGNTIGGIRFSVSSANEVTNQARADAMDDANAKAQQLADLAGAELGPVVSIAENSLGGMPYLPAGAEAGGGATLIEPGNQTLQVVLQVTYLLQ